MKKCSIFISVLLLLALVSCSSPQPIPTLSIPTGATVSATPSPEETPDAIPTPVSSSSPTAAGSTASPLTLEAYRLALEAIYNDHLYPNGDPVDVPAAALLENNDFAIFDVDGDGLDELLYQNEDSTMAGMMTTVFGSMPSADGVKLFTEISGFAGMIPYDNGILTIDFSHNQGLAGTLDFWPYAIYRYDPGQDGYLMVASVDAWDGETRPHDFGGTPFPDDVDQDGDKVVYWISYPGEEVTYEWLDGPEYLQWRDSYLAGATALEIPWQSMTLENIRAVAP